MNFTPDFQRRNRLEQIRLAAYTTMRIGGPATLVTLEAREDLPELLAMPHRWLGRGANLLVGDDGVAEPVVRLGAAFSAIQIGDVVGGRAVVTVGAATDLAELIAACIKAGLAGPEGLAGVPATVGGALKMNAGTSTCWMLDWVSRVEVILPGENTPRWLERAALPASYRSCGLPAGTVILSCEMILVTGDPVVLKATASRLKQAKAASQPLALPSAGCVFKNSSPTMPTGKIIDELGLKGERCGDAEISTVHANFIVNRTRTASCADVVALIRRIREQAWRERGVVLTMEVETWNCPAELHVHPRRLSETTSEIASGKASGAAV